MPSAVLGPAIGLVGNKLLNSGKKEKTEGRGAPEWLGPAIGAGANVIGSVLASRGQSRAARAGERGASEALAFERDKENRRRMEYDQQQALLRQRYDAGVRRRQSILRAFGMLNDAPAPAAPMTSTAPTMAPPPVTLGTLSGRQPPLTAPEPVESLPAPQPMTAMNPGPVGPPPLPGQNARPRPRTTLGSLSRRSY